MASRQAQYDWNETQPAGEGQLYYLEGEAVLIGAMLVKNSIADVIADILQPEDFYEPIHGALYASIVDLIVAGKSVSPVTLIPFFANDPRFQQLGGAGFLANLTASSAVLLIDHKQQAEGIAELAARRRLIESLDEARARVSKLDVTLPQLVDDADAALVAAVERRDVANQPTAAQALDEVMERIAEIKRNDGKVGVTTGISDIDRLLGGFEPGQLVVMAGRPGMGKTAVACSAAVGAAQQGHGVLFVSLEMRSLELGMRIASDLCFHGTSTSQRAAGIPFSRIVNAEVNDQELRAIARARSEIADMPLTIVDAGSVSLARLALSVRRHKRRMKAQGRELKLVVIDYLQLLVASKNAKSAYEAVSEISKALKALAKDAGVAILALAQLSRAVEQRDDKRPMLSDLRDSGQIEQDADAVLFLYREEYYLARSKPKRTEAIEAWENALHQCSCRIDFILAKRRNGRTGSATGWYYAHYQAVRGSDDTQGGLDL